MEFIFLIFIVVVISAIIAECKSLQGRVALVTGASRGIGRGIALGLAEEGATVYVTGRSATEATTTEIKLGGSLEGVVTEIGKLGGIGYSVQCDHSKDQDVEKVFDVIKAREGKLDILVNNAFAVPKRPDGESDGELLFRDFWEQPGWFYDSFMNVGLRSHYIASGLAVPLLRNAGKGSMIFHISSFGGISYSFNVAYGVGKAGVDRMALDMARELDKLGIDCVSIWPGVVRTERMNDMIDNGDFERRTGLYYPPEYVESPRLTGRVIAALYADTAKRSERNGQVAVVAEVAREHKIVDLSGSTPPSIRSLKFLLPAVILGKMGRERRDSDRGRLLQKWLQILAPDILLPMSVMAGGAPAPDK